MLQKVTLAAIRGQVSAHSAYLRFSLAWRTFQCSGGPFSGMADLSVQWRTIQRHGGPFSAVEDHSAACRNFSVACVAKTCIYTGIFCRPTISDEIPANVQVNSENKPEIRMMA
ncbi:hypothetical protein [Cohnella sp. GCM10012308]|uniref:hypothetical protein n=1 Tax=Cohnella sp. GCM10012308 TaxID=3317329 RepID=UPI003611B550